MAGVGDALRRRSVLRARGDFEHRFGRVVIAKPRRTYMYSRLSISLILQSRRLVQVSAGCVCLPLPVDSASAGAGHHARRGKCLAMRFTRVL